MDKIYHFSAPGRTEIGGNHTDHQHGCVIAAAGRRTDCHGRKRPRNDTEVSQCGGDDPSVTRSA